MDLSNARIVGRLESVSPLSFEGCDYIIVRIPLDFDGMTSYEPEVRFWSAELSRWLGRAVKAIVLVGDCELIGVRG
jgi:hypothetical protein